MKEKMEELITCMKIPFLPNNMAQLNIPAQIGLYYLLNQLKIVTTH